MFPEQEFFTLNQVASHWGVEIDDIQHAIVSKKLKAHLWVYNTLMRKVEPDTYTGSAIVSPITYINGCMELCAADCRRFFIKRYAAIRQFPADNFSYYQLIEHVADIELEYDNIVILHSEKTRFEMEHSVGKKVMATFTYSSNFREVRYADYHFKFGKIQSSVVRQLYEVLQDDNPWLYGKTLLKNAKSKTIVMHNLFKHKKHWQKLIESNGNGFYRLSSDIAAPSLHHHSTTIAPS